MKLADPTAAPTDQHAPEITLPTLDMTAVTREALGGLKSRAWSLEYLCSGVTFKWAGYATTQQDADEQARQHLDQYANFSPKSAQLIAALEV